VTAKVRKEM